MFPDKPHKDRFFVVVVYFLKGGSLKVDFTNFRWCLSPENPLRCLVFCQWTKAKEYAAQRCKLTRNLWDARPNTRPCRPNSRLISTEGLCTENANCTLNWMNQPSSPHEIENWWPRRILQNSLTVIDRDQNFVTAGTGLGLPPSRPGLRPGPRWKWNTWPGPGSV